MKLNEKEVLVCDCEGTMTIDGKALAKACQQEARTGAARTGKSAKEARTGKARTGTKQKSDKKAGQLDIASHLCRTQIEEFQRLAGKNDSLLVACTQEAPVFVETLDEMGDKAPKIRFTNIRERAGWSKDAEAKASKTDMTAKMAALLAEAALDIEDSQSVTMVSGGALLILGHDETALDAAKKVSSRLDVTVLLEPGASLPPPKLMDVPVFTGRVAEATGHLGEFQVTIEDFAPATPSSKASLAFDEKSQTGTSVCDLILDLRGGTPLTEAAARR